VCRDKPKSKKKTHAHGWKKGIRNMHHNFLWVSGSSQEKKTHRYRVWRKAQKTVFGMKKEKMVTDATNGIARRARSKGWQNDLPAITSERAEEAKKTTANPKISQRKTWGKAKERTQRGKS